MVDVWIPYGKTEVCVSVESRNLLGVIEPKRRKGVENPEEEIRRALSSPMGTEPLRKLVSPGDKVAIVVDDHTRKAPTRLMLPPLLKELEEAGVRREDITVIFGCGSHRAVRPEEQVKILGENLVGRIKAISHDCEAKDLVYLGKTSYGNEIYVNRTFAEADIKILTGDVNLHFFAGYGGGRKSVLPGVSALETIRRNHAMLLNPKAQTGVLEGNPIHEDMTEAVRLADVDFTLNTVSNSSGELVGAYAGDVHAVFEEGVKTVDDLFKVPIKQKADIVVVSPGGYPYDIDLYQAYKGIDSALKAVKDGGVMIVAAECPDGHGSQLFYDWMTKFKTMDELEDEIRHRFVIGGHKAYYVRKALERVEMFLVSVMPEHEVREVFGMRPAKSVNDALKEALRITGPDSQVYIITHGSTTLPTLTP